MYTYVWYHWITFFFIYCFLGWVFESIYVSVKEREPVNRGFLRLPLLPLYGTGAITMLWVSLPVKENLFLVYVFGVIGSTILEYITGCVMELLFKVRYWDYSTKKYNFQGYICLGSSVAWGFLTILMTEVLHRPVERFVLSLPQLTEFTGILLTGILFGADTIRSAREAFNLARALETMAKLKTEAEAMQAQLALLKAEILQRTFELRNETEAALSARAERLIRRLEAISKRRESFGKHMSFYRRRLLKGNPTATSRKFAETLRELRDSLRNRG